MFPFETYLQFLLIVLHNRGGAGTSCFNCDNTFPGSCPGSEPETKRYVYD